MSSFKKQIEEDILEYQNDNPHIPNISNDAWAFNYWILDKLFHEDEELIEGKILDYHDLGIDAFEIYEETKEVYIIQNKYYSDATPIAAEYVKNDFLLRPITALENGTYKKSQELQVFFNKYKNHEDFTVYLQLYISNDLHCREAEEYIKEFNRKHSQYRAQIFYLSDIEEKYFGEIKQVTQNITAKIQSVNKGTILSINPAYKLENALSARYVYTPVVSLYRLYREAIEQNYPLFEKNIREYLGNRGVNKNMYTTLLDPEDRKNFFYYNNGITIICDQMSKILTHADNNMQDMQASFEIKNPQIVNGCQTVNTIYEVLKNVDPAIVEKEYKDAFVMLKVLVIDKNDESESTLYKNIVRYNNSQSPIDEKTFVANTSIFIRLQEEFENKGFLLLIKQSDKNTFSLKYKTVTKLAKANRVRIQKFNLPETKKASDVYIPLEKLLQVINAFVSGGFVAYKKKSSMLKIDSKEYNTAIGFIKDGAVTIDMLLDLYLLYKCAEKAKKDGQDKRTPIPYYLIDAFAKYDCCNRERELILPNLESAEKIAKTIKHYTVVLRAYCNQYKTKYGLDYGVMIKRDIDYNILDENHAVYSDID